MFLRETMSHPLQELSKVFVSLAYLQRLKIEANELIKTKFSFKFNVIDYLN